MEDFEDKGSNPELSDKLEELTTLLKDNYLLSSVVILTVENTSSGGTEIRASKKGNFHEVVGMLRDYECQLISNHWHKNP